jgi:uncharacterized protein YukE
MAIRGADIEQLAALKATFDQQTQAVQQMTSSITSQIEGAFWKGPAAERFRQSWASDFQPMLQNLQTSMQEAGGDVDRQRSELEAVTN